MEHENEYRRPATTDEAIWEMHAQIVQLTTTVSGTRGSKDGGMVGDMSEIKALAVEVKDIAMNHEGRISAIEARCAERGVSCPGPISKKQAFGYAGGGGVIGAGLAILSEWLKHFFTSGGSS